MRIELSGFVVVTHTIEGTDDDFALTFPGDEFSSTSAESGFGNSSGELTYQGTWVAVEEGVQVRLSFTATRDGFTEKVWEIIGDSLDPLLDPRIAEDRIAIEFIED